MLLIVPSFRMLDNRVEGSFGNAFSHISLYQKIRSKNFSLNNIPTLSI